MLDFPGVSNRILSFADCSVHGIELSPTARASTAVIFLHGRYGEAALWQPVARSLGASARSLMLDLPGFGGSFTTRDGLSLMESASLLREAIADFARARETVILVGHDVGGAIALMTASHLGAKISGTIVISPACITRPPQGLRAGMWGWRHTRQAKIQCEATGRLPPEMRKKLLAPWRVRGSRASRSSALAQMEQSWPRHYERLAWKRELGRIEQPVLILWGAGDRLNPPVLGNELLRQLPNAELIEDPLSAYWVFLENPTWVADRLREFLFRVARKAA